MNEIIFVTHNKGKIATAKKQLQEIDFKVFEYDLEEPRSDDIKYISKYKVMEAYKVTYILYCIGKFAHHYHLSDKQAYAYLRRHKGIDFLGDKAGIHLNYGADFTLFGARDGKLFSEKPAFDGSNMYQNEIDAFLRCIRTGEKLPAHIDNAVITAKMMQAIYDSSDCGREITF